MSYGKEEGVNNDTFRKVEPEYPIENQYWDDDPPPDENPFETVGKNKKDGDCGLIFLGMITVGAGSVLGIASLIYNALT